MTRFVLTDAQWERIEPHCLGKATDPGRTGGDARLFLEAVLWILTRSHTRISFRKEKSSSSEGDNPYDWNGNGSNASSKRQQTVGRAVQGR